MSEHTFKLFRSQRKVLTSDSEVILMLSGRGVGKSTVATHWALNKIVNQPDVLGCIGTPSHSQTNDLMTKMCNLLADLGLPYVLGKQPPSSWGSKLAEHKQYLSVLLPSGELAQVRYGSLENYESFRGLSVGWLIVDECALVREVAYKEVLLPALRGYGSDHKYQQLLLTTPKGISSWTSELLERSYVEVIRAASKENFIEFTEDKLEKIKEMMSERQYRQEILGEVINLSERSQFHAFNASRVDDKPLTHFRWALASDQNISPQIVNIIQYTKDHIHLYDEIHIEGGSTVADMVAALRKKEYLHGNVINLYGDRSGNNRQLTTDTSYYQQLISRCKDIGINLNDKTLTKNPPVYDSRELVNAWMEKEKLTVSHQCKNTIVDLEKAQYTEDFKTDKKAYDPHHTDAIAYFVWKEFGRKSQIKTGIYL